MAGEKWITFDCFGTLVDWQSGYRAILAPVAGDRVDELVTAYHSAEPVVEKEFPGARYRTILRESVRRAADTIGLSTSDSDRDRLAEHWGELPVFADTAPALLALRADGWR